MGRSGGAARRDGVNAVRSPALARAVIAVLALRDDRAPLIGDLEEEFVSRARESEGSAAGWYWGQTLASAPSLAWRRLSGEGARRVAAVAAVTVFAYVAIMAWEVTIARPMTQELSRTFGGPPAMLMRGVYLVAQMAGVAAAGAVIAGLTFRRQVGFWSNVARRVAPLGFALIVPTAIIMAFTADTYPATFRLAWMAAAAPSLLAGAWLGDRLRAQPKI